ncbi:uncharacterized protein LOC127263855 [Andrographis paniculata]|uniref:uncharacterized protein LOC127263855 n=1 Tax=Andrographis paniculata TaxID=175694 RepID=UPI0021E99FCC|nr:uncharacterized protein LOC127263855 [Andrographis paniculata]
MEESGEDSGSEVRRSRRSNSEAKQREDAPTFLEVICKCSGKIRRFSVGTEAGFAVNLMNKKLISDGGMNISLATYIEAFKEGEEPISFGPSSLLVDYGSGWKLQTVVDSQGNREAHTRQVQKESPKGTYDSKSRGSGNQNSKIQSGFTLVYMGKILLAFLFMFIFGAIVTLGLENLPHLILYINSLV